MDYHWKDQYISLLDVIATSYLSVNNQTLFSDLSLLLKGGYWVMCWYKILLAYLAQLHTCMIPAFQMLFCIYTRILHLSL